MARPLNDSPYLYGLHDPGGEYIMAEKGIPGWILFTEKLGHDPGDLSGGNYSAYADQGFGIMVRLNNGYEDSDPNGTIPFAARYAEFAQRCANFVRSSRGCHIWIIGNETNLAGERPGVRIDRSQGQQVLVNPGETILPGMYVRCYRLCRDAIKGVPGHENDQVIVGGVAPWNAQTKYAGNESGDWVKYLQDILLPLAPDGCDGIAIHTYTHGHDPKLIYTDAFMDAPFGNRQYNFRAYQDFMNAIPRSLRSLPVYLTETDQNDPWRNENNNWVERAYGEIDWWNRQPGTQVIRAVILYRWPNRDQWVIEGRAGVIEDFKTAMNHKYNWETVLAGKQTLPEPVTPPVVVTPPVTPVVVTPAIPSTEPITFPEVKRSTSGLFAAFHRQYGLDITGFPLTEVYVSSESGLRTQDWQRLSMEEFNGKIRLRLVGDTAARLKQEVAALQDKLRRVEGQPGQLQPGGAPAAPAISDITDQLPRVPARFIKRAASDIQYLVVNHTAVRPEVGADRVAQSHARKWPGIVAQYFITGDGQIQQTNPLDEVVEREQASIYNGINIYLAGNFDEMLPSAAQLAALAELCAWLLHKYDLPETAIRGASEFIITRSPGLQWLQGQKYKEQLLELVRARPVAPVTPVAPTPMLDDGQLAALRAEIDELQMQAVGLQADLMAAEAERAHLQAQVEALLRGQPGPAQPTRPALTDISVQLPRTEGSLKARPAEQIKFLVFNHTAVAPTVAAERIAKAHQQRWGAILYQYLITGEGSILQTNALTEVVDQSQQWIAEGINIAVAGSFGAEIPSASQIQAAADLSAWLMQEYRIPIENVKGVSEFIVTQSPGTQWLQGKRWKDTLLAAITAVQEAAGPTPVTPGGASAADAATIADLRSQVAQLKASLSTATSNAAALQQERDRLQAQLNQGLGSSQLAKQVQTLSQQVQTLTTEKAALEKQAQAFASEKTTLTAQLQTLGNDKATLSQQVLTLTKDKSTLAQQVTAATAEKTAFTQQIAALQQQIVKLQSGIATPATPTTPTGPQIAQKPETVDVVDKLPVHATKRYATRTLDKITHIAVHHSAGPANLPPERIAQVHLNNDWPGMGYHFYVGPEGVIYQTNRLETVSNHVYMQNGYAVGICVAGSFINGLIPTQKQIEAVGRLSAWLMQTLNIPLKNVLGHKEFPSNQTACPGNDWTVGKKWKELLIAQIKAAQQDGSAAAAKIIGHYMLFWQRADGWAQEDWTAAANYFAKFRPTTGFRPEDARNAEYVTIVGGVGGVPYATEQMLLAAGCKVERLAGVDFTDTKRMLDELANTGRRFKTFNV